MIRAIRIAETALAANDIEGGDIEGFAEAVAIEAVQFATTSARMMPQSQLSTYSFHESTVPGC